MNNKKNEKKSHYKKININLKIKIKINIRK